MQKYKPQKISSKRKKVDEFVIDETQIKVGSRYIWLWVAIEPKHRQILHIDISFERIMRIVDERFIVASLINNFGKHLFQHQTTLWSMVSPSSMSIFETKTSSSFSV
jgi:putative transposase